MPDGGNLEDDLRPILNDTSLTAAERNAAILAATRAHFGQGGVLTKANSSEGKRSARFELAPPESAGGDNAPDVSAHASRPEPRMTFAEWNRATQPAAEQTTPLPGEKATDAGVPVTPYKLPALEPGRPMTTVDASDIQPARRGASASGVGLNDVTATNAQEYGPNSPVAQSLMGPNRAPGPTPQPNVLGGNQEAPAPAGAPSPVAGTPGPGYQAPSPATPGAAPGAATPAASDVGQAMSGIDALGQLRGGGGGPPTITKQQSEALMMSPEVAKAYNDAMAERSAAQARIEAGVLAYHQAGAERGAHEAGVIQGASAQWEQQARAAEDERRAQMAEIQARTKQADEARQAFIDSIRDQPLGTALNPDGAQRVMGAIGLALGGALQGFRGGPNPALQIINTAIDRDLKVRAERLQAGKAAVDATDNALQTSVNELGTWAAGMAQMRANLKEGVDLKLGYFVSLAGSEQAKQAGIVASEQLKASAAQDRMEALSKLATHVTQTRTIHTGGAGLDPLKRLKDIEAVKAAWLENEKRRRALEGGGGADTPAEQHAIDVVLRYEHTGRMVQQAVGMQQIQSAIKGGGGTPNAVLRFLNEAIDRNGSKGTVGAAFATVESMIARAGFTEAERAQANRFVRALNAYIYASSGAQINETEATRLKAALGLRTGSTVGEIMAGLQDMGKLLQAERTKLKAAYPKAYERVMGGLMRQYAAGDGATPDGYDPTRLGPAPGQP